MCTNLDEYEEELYREAEEFPRNSKLRKDVDYLLEAVDSLERRIPSIEESRYELSEDILNKTTYIRLKKEEYIQKASGYSITLEAGAVGFLVDTLEHARYLELTEEEYIAYRKQEAEDSRLALVGGALITVASKNYQVLSKRPGFVIGEIIK